MTTDGIPTIRSALASLSPDALCRVSHALVAGKDNPAVALAVAREIISTNREAAETFLGVAEILAAELARKQQ